MALGGQERVRHPARDKQPVGRLGRGGGVRASTDQVPDDGQLVGNLGAAEHDHIGPGRAGGQLPEHRDLGEDQLAGRVRQQQGRVVDAGVLAVHGAESVAHVPLGERGEAARELTARPVVLAGLGGLEADVLQHRDLAAGEAGGAGAGRFTGHVGGQRNRLAEQFREPGRHRRQRGPAGRPLGVAVPLRAAQVRADDHLGAAAHQIPQRRQAGPDPPVVGDRRAIHGHVQVGANQDGPARDIEIVSALHRPRRSVTQRNRAGRRRSALTAGPSRPGRRGRPAGSSSRTRCRTSRRS